MREIKFRGIIDAKKKEGKTWVYGFYFNKVKNHYIKNMKNEFKVLPETVGQWTGLKDKNGKDIYEGDIVQSVSWNEFFTTDAGEPMKAFQRILIVEFYDGAFCLKEVTPMRAIYWDIRNDSKLSVSGDLKIIGNIYDNPELIPKMSEYEIAFDVSRE